jgi:hypothetical protein
MMDKKFHGSVVWQIRRKQMKMLQEFNVKANMVYIGRKEFQEWIDSYEARYALDAFHKILEFDFKIVQEVSYLEVAFVIK